MLLGLAGDVMIGRLVDEELERVAPEYIWGDLLELLRSTDLNLINLEAALTTNTTGEPKVFTFKSDPRHVESLRTASIDVVNLANNHVLDYGPAGLVETLETLDRAGIFHVGAGQDSERASAPVLIERGGVRVCIIGSTDNEPGWNAGSLRPGVRFLEIRDPGAILEQVDEMRDQVQLIIASLHWGPNMRQRPPESFRWFAHRLIEGGVDIVHGHSAHIFQGVEVHGRGLILYDTGDFLDDYYIDPLLRNDQSFLFLVEANAEGVRGLRLIPTIIGHFQVRRARGEEALGICERMQALSAELGTALTLTKGRELKVLLKP